MKTLYAYCPSCRAPARVDSFAGRTVYLTHGNRHGKQCKQSGESCYYIARDHFAGGRTDRASVK